MKKLLNIFAFAVIALFAHSAIAAEPYKDITADDLVKMKKEDPKLVIIDARGSDWFDGVMIEGATQLATSDTNAESLAKLAPKKDQAIVFYCTDENCPASVKSNLKAAELGYTNLYEYKGGIADWKKHGYPTTGVAKKEAKEEVKKEDKKD